MFAFIREFGSTCLEILSWVYFNHSVSRFSALNDHKQTGRNRSWACNVQYLVLYSALTRIHIVKGGRDR